MKKLLISPLMVGVFSMCFGNSTPSRINQLATSQVSQAEIVSPSMNQIFSAASTQFWEVHGIVITIEELFQGHDDGTVTVSQSSSGDKWLVQIDGGLEIAVSEDNF